ncbi:MAG: extracellular solute-binding protein [Clostridiales bacterium]|nr:extracellular solute-binding protein [Clostridiales bacterium]
MKKTLAIILSTLLVLAMVTTAFATEVPTFDGFVLGTDYTDITATIKVLSHRTDLVNDGVFGAYVEEFNKVYPNITVEYEGLTDYAEDITLRLTGGDSWGDVMMLPASLEADEFSNYYTPLGNLAEMTEIYNFINNKQFEGTVYGIPSTGNAQGIVYNKAVFEKAGITELPKTPEAFIAALQAIKDNTDATPLYTNYAAGWTMGAWDAYLGGSATGDPDFMNIKMLHDADPFSDRGDATGPYAVYKVLYDAVAAGLIEDDYTTTDWESSKVMINNGEIGCMVLGSWAFSQMVEAGPNGDDIGYMSFPITVDGVQSASAGADYCYAINAKADANQQIAAMVYVKWMTYESKFAYNEGGIPINKDGEYPALYAAFEGIEFVPDTNALDSEATLPDELNTESALSLNRGNNEKVQKIVEAAFNQSQTIDEIMANWNEAWATAQTDLGVTVE